MSSFNIFSKEAQEEPFVEIITSENNGENFESLIESSVGKESSKGLVQPSTLRRSARIAAKEKKKDTNQQADFITTKKVGNSKKKSSGKSSFNNFSKEAQEEPFVEIITSGNNGESFESLIESSVSKENSKGFVQPSAEILGGDEAPGKSVNTAVIEKGKSKNTKPVRTRTAQKTSKKIVQHSDGSKSIFEPINLEWLQSKREDKDESRNPDDYGDMDDSDDWEEVDLSQYKSLQDDPVDDSNKIITITFSAPKVEYKPRGVTKIERTIRQNIHKTHLLTLLVNGIIRNKWCNDQLTQAMACSLIERDMLALFDKALRPKDSSRGQLLITAMQELCDWWKKYFIISKPEICYREYHEFGTKGVVEDVEEFSDVLTSIKSFRRSLKVGEGSRDTSAQLFVALLRSFGIPARLVCSLQVVSFKFARKNNSKKPEGDSSDSVKSTGQNVRDIEKTFDIEKYSLSSKNQGSSSKRKERGDDDDYVPYQKKSAVCSRKSLNVSNSGQSKLFPKHYAYDLDSPPIFWCEVYFAVHKKWFCIDPTRALVNRPKSMEPSPTSKNNVMAYVVAFEQDGYIKDVTRRYASQWGAKTRKLRIPSTKDGYNWWDETLAYFARPYEREQDSCEDASLLFMEISERMPTTISAFHNHPLYALERHLKKFEIISPKLPILGRIRGEPIYPRKSVKQLHTAETWLREGRQVMEGQQPIKHVKSRIYTLAKRRAANMAELFNEEPLESGLYGEWQTEIYQPDPVVDGKVPKNQYGNVNLFKPSMCPPGGVHLPYNGMGKIAKKFGIDYGEAVVGFEFQSQRCVPVANGIVVPEEHAEILLEAWREHSRNVEEANRAKKLKEIYGNWRKLIIGLQIRQRLKDDYGGIIEEDLSLDCEDEGEDEFYHGEDTDEEKVEESDQHIDVKDRDENVVVNVGDEGECVDSQDENRKGCGSLSAGLEECETEADLYMENADPNSGEGNDVDMVDASSYVEGEFNGNNSRAHVGAATDETLIEDEDMDDNYNDPSDSMGGFLLE